MAVPDRIKLWVCSALVGQIYPAIRAIALRFDSQKCLHIRYYFDRQPTEDDLEDMEVVITEIFANTSSEDDIRDLNKEAVCSSLPSNELDPLDCFIYARREE